MRQPSHDLPRTGMPAAASEMHTHAPPLAHPRSTGNNARAIYFAVGHVRPRGAPPHDNTRVATAKGIA